MSGLPAAVRMRKEDALASLTTFSTSQAVTTAPFLDEVGTARNRRAGILRDRLARQSRVQCGHNRQGPSRTEVSQTAIEMSRLRADRPPSTRCA
jgi:hypothetical protein